MLKVKILGGPEPWNLHIEDAETGEQFQNVTDFSITADRDLLKVNLTMLNVYVEIDADADVTEEHNVYLLEHDANGEAKQVKARRIHP